MNLKTYLSAKRGRQAKLAKAIDAYAPDVSRWADGLRPIPDKYGAPIELATGGAVTRQEMFPDTWQSIWPELAQQSKKQNDTAEQVRETGGIRSAPKVEVSG